MDNSCLSDEEVNFLYKISRILNDTPFWARYDSFKHELLCLFCNTTYSLQEELSSVLNTKRQKYIAHCKDHVSEFKELTPFI